MTEKTHRMLFDLSGAVPGQRRISQEPYRLVSAGGTIDAVVLRLYVPTPARETTLEALHDRYEAAHLRGEHERSTWIVNEEKNAVDVPPTFYQVPVDLEAEVRAEIVDHIASVEGALVLLPSKEEVELDWAELTPEQRVAFVGHLTSHMRRRVFQQIATLGGLEVREKKPCSDARGSTSGTDASASDATLETTANSTISSKNGETRSTSGRAASGSPPTHMSAG